MINSPMLPSAVRVIILEYVEEKTGGLYGHTKSQQRRFKAKITTDAQLDLAGRSCPSSEILRQEAGRNLSGESGASGVSFVLRECWCMDGFAFDPFSFQQDGLTASEVDVGRC